jgi:NitT/TauT family transport system ATP-binding protein
MVRAAQREELSQTPHIDFDAVAVMYDSRGRTTEAVREVSGQVPRGAFVSIVGPSGCGKTTLLDLVAGLRAPSRGTVRIDGEAVSGPRKDTAIVFQEDSTLHWRSVLDNVAFGLEVRQVPRSERTARARHVIEALGLTGFEKHKPSELSGGMRQRVAIGRAFALDPRLLLMDEPFGALDQLTRRSVGDVLLDLWWSEEPDERKTVLFVTHDTTEAVFLSDEVWVLSARPCELLTRVPVPLSRPRTKPMMTSPELQQVVRQVEDALDLPRPEDR